MTLNPNAKQKNPSSLPSYLLHPDGLCGFRIPGMGVDSMILISNVLRPLIPVVSSSNGSNQATMDKLGYAEVLPLAAMVSGH